MAEINTAAAHPHALRSVQHHDMGAGELEEAYRGDAFELEAAAAALRDARKGRVVTFSKKVFISVTSLCRDVCTYCTYRREPDAAPAMMPPSAVAALLDAARAQGCVEALLVAGERPEDRYGEAAEWLASHGMASTAEYIARCSEMALERGLFPHTNAGNMTREELAVLGKTNASVGMMLESSSPRLGLYGMPHHGAPSKDPARRIAALEEAGRLGIPTTTGILVGIGETPLEAAESIVEIRRIARRYGHIQEVIIQNFQPEPRTAMSSHAPATEDHLRRVVAMARLAMPDANIQAPPNLSPGSYARLLGSGINDWGGISPVTPDYVNPAFAWPAIRDVEARTRRAGFEPKCRFPVYPEYAPMVPRRLRKMMAECSDGAGHVDARRWR